MGKSVFLPDRLPGETVRQSRALVRQYFGSVVSDKTKSGGVGQTKKSKASPSCLSPHRVPAGRYFEVSAPPFWSLLDPSFGPDEGRAEGDQKWLDDFRPRTPEGEAGPRPSPYRSSAQGAIGFGKTH